MRAALQDGRAAARSVARRRGAGGGAGRGRRWSTTRPVDPAAAADGGAAYTIQVDTPDAAAVGAGRGGAARGAGRALGDDDQPGARRRLADARRCSTAIPARCAIALGGARLAGARMRRGGAAHRAAAPAAAAARGQRRARRDAGDAAASAAGDEPDGAAAGLAGGRGRARLHRRRRRNADAVRHLGHWSLWPVTATLLTGPRKSGRSLLGRIFAAKSRRHADRRCRAARRGGDLPRLEPRAGEPPAAADRRRRARRRPGRSRCPICARGSPRRRASRSARPTMRSPPR